MNEREALKIKREAIELLSWFDKMGDLKLSQIFDTDDDKNALEYVRNGYRWLRDAKLADIIHRYSHG